MAPALYHPGRHQRQLHGCDCALPAGQLVQPVVMEAGDVLFFDGALVHGSYPNTSPDRFRRALIGHYIEGRAEQVAEFYHPALCMDGRVLTLETSAGGGACGEWVEGRGRGCQWFR